MHSLRSVSVVLNGQLDRDAPIGVVTDSTCMTISVHPDLMDEHTADLLTQAIQAARSDGR